MLGTFVGQVGSTRVEWYKPTSTCCNSYSFSSFLQVAFEDVIGEPDGAHSIDCVWKLAYKCFTGGNSICYLLLTVCCAVPVALCWGCEFACITFAHIWHITPALKVVEINCRVCRTIYGAIVSCFLTPICEACSVCFSNIKVTQSD